MIGIIGAMEAEVSAICEMLENAESQKVGTMAFTTGTLEGKDIVVATCGIGKVFAAACTQAMIMQYAPSVILNTGVAGAVAPELEIGDIVIGTDAVQHDMDTSSLGDTLGQVSGLDVLAIPCSPAISEVLAKCVQAAGAKAVHGTVASGDQFIHSAQKKRWISDVFGGVCCEMEGGAIAQVCYVNKVDFGIVRAISDKADGAAGRDYMEFLRMALEKSTQVVREFALRYTV